MQNITGQPVVGDNLYGRDYEMGTLWERRDGDRVSFRSNLLRRW